VRWRAQYAEIALFCEKRATVFSDVNTCQFNMNYSQGTLAHRPLVSLEITLGEYIFFKVPHAPSAKP
jgi:hypothetical protein